MFTATSMKIGLTLRVVRQMFARQPSGFNLSSTTTTSRVYASPPWGLIASQFDGDYLGVRETMTFRSRRPRRVPLARKKADLSCRNKM